MRRREQVQVEGLRARFLPQPFFPTLVVCMVCGDPIGRKSFLRDGYVDLFITDQVTHQPL
jgi:hypothetical protein